MRIANCMESRAAVKAPSSRVMSINDIWWVNGLSSLALTPSTGNDDINKLIYNEAA